MDDKCACGTKLEHKENSIWECPECHQAYSLEFVPLPTPEELDKLCEGGIDGVHLD